MSSTGSDDALRIPIEIKTDDLEEIRELINNLSDAESDIRSVTPRRGRGRGDTSSRSAFTPSSEESGGIFGQMGGEAMPTQGRDKKSRTPFQRENEFSKLKNQVEGVEQQQTDMMKGALGTVTQATGFAQLIGGGGVIGKIKGIATKAFLPLAIVTAVTELVTGVVSALIAPGAPFDIRFKRVISDEISSATEREEKAEIRQGLRTIRISPIAGFRGGGANIAGEQFKKGLPIYDQNFNMLGRGL
jgi:hypothetical protein